MTQIFSTLSFKTSNKSPFFAKRNNIDILNKGWELLWLILNTQVYLPFVFVVF